MTRRVIPIGLQAAGPVVLPSITAPTLALTNQTVSSVTITASYSGFQPITDFLFQISTTTSGGPFVLLGKQVSGVLSSSAPPTGVSYYYRVAAIVNDGRQSTWSPIVTVTGTATPTNRRWAPGWGTVLNNSQIYPGGTYLGIPNANKVAAAGPCAPGVTMIVAPHTWNEFEPHGKTDPAGTGPGQRFSGLLPIIGNELAQCATFANPTTGPSNPVLYIPRVIFKTQNNFGGINPLPADMTGLATAISGGWSAWRWNPTFVSRYNDLCVQINALFGSGPGNNVYFGGIMTQETATSFTPNGTTDGYTDALLQSALIAEAESIVSGSSLTRPYFMLNDWPTTNLSVPAGTMQLAIVCKNIKQYGAIIGFPDLATSTSVVGRYYALIQACHTGGTFTNSAGSVNLGGVPFGTYGCMQPDEWGGNPPSHGSGPGDYPVNIPNLVNYATSSFTFKPSAGYTGALDWTGSGGRTSLLNLDCLFPDWHTADTSSPNTGGPAPPNVFNPDASGLIALLPQFGSVTPSP